MTIETRRDLIEPWPTREACIVANRRALALMLRHHGHIPPERGCSAEAQEIRRRLARLPRRSTALLDLAKAAGVATIDDVIRFAAGRHGSAEIEMIAERGPQRARLARREAFYLAHRLLGLSFTEIGREFGRDRMTIGETVRFFEASGGS